MMEGWVSDENGIWKRMQRTVAGAIRGDCPVHCTGVHGLHPHVARQAKSW